MKLVKSRIIFLLLGIVAICAVVLSYHAVDNSLSPTDRQYIPLYLNDIVRLEESRTYTEELAFIVAVQRSVLDIAPNNKALPLNQKRGPKEVYHAKSGECFDRSRVIEKILRYSDFETRHVAIYSKEKTGSALKSLITSGIPSHAVTEVLTKNGWLVVDSNAPWVSTDANNQPISISSIQRSIEDSLPIYWNHTPPTNIYVQPFTFVYGLYSRHGRFYAPYNFIPDVHYGELIDNVL